MLIDFRHLARKCKNTDKRKMRQARAHCEKSSVRGAVAFLSTTLRKTLDAYKLQERYDTDRK